MNARRICVGIITRPFGIEGQVRLHPYTNSPDFFLQNKKLLLESDVEVLLKEPRIGKNGDVISWIDGVHDRTTADALRLKKVFVLRDDLEPLEDAEYYYEDLIGLKVADENHEHLGVVKAIQDYGAGVFLEIKVDGNKVGTVQFTKEAVINVGLKDCEIMINRRFFLI